MAVFSGKILGTGNSAVLNIRRAHLIISSFGIVNHVTLGAATVHVQWLEKYGAELSVQKWDKIFLFLS
jgi:hypothetical protein